MAGFLALGGFFMHARGGLQTAYLSEEWMECVNACLDEAGKLGMDAWLYDENGWPSGFGGGLVNGLGVKYQQKYLRHEIIAAAEACKDDTTIAFYTTDGALIGRTLPEDSTGPVLRCYYEINPFYVDNLDAEVVAEFIRVTHEFYYRTIPEELLKHLKGISDEAISEFNLPTAVPYVFEFDEGLNYAGDRFLGDPDEIARLMSAVADQGRKG